MKLTSNQLTDILTDKILQKRDAKHILFIGIDGIDCSGKTTLASKLKQSLELNISTTLVIHVDDFLYRECDRNKLGSMTPESFYYHFFNYHVLASQVLEPLKLEGKVNYSFERVKIQMEKDVFDDYEYTVHDCNIVIVEGLFLLKPEIAEYLDIVIRLHIDNETVVERALKRDVNVFGSKEYVKQGYLLQSLPAQDIYRALHQPDDKADILIDNSNPLNPVLRRSVL